ncbi:DUF2511 domain-containing protein [Chromobacterium alkanivorans]|uniref:DUF2511 domain-containing protein n=1 Tax=Chromobacterium alkanivorans TaxID=1071719 RepID=UPI00196703B6|nr:DUF2511 domain-containing protein [Chromobacterium alkanivorans]MBN3005599.1 DUF2511 domain-containing protein [Chromobacterium alkanivorans]
MHWKKCAVAALVGLLAGCGEPADQVTVTKAEYGERWPLKTDKAVLHCDQPDVAYVDVGGKWYALNGGGLRQGLPRTDEIRKDPDNVSVADFIELAISICQKNK